MYLQNKILKSAKALKYILSAQQEIVRGCKTVTWTNHTMNMVYL